MVQVEQDHVEYSFVHANFAASRSRQVCTVKHLFQYSSIFPIQAKTLDLPLSKRFIAAVSPPLFRASLFSLTENHFSALVSAKSQRPGPTST